MLPELRVLGVEVHTHILLLVTAVVGCLWLGPKWASRLEGLDARRVRWVLLWLGVAAFAGGRAHFLANTWWSAMFVGQRWAMLRFWSGLHAGGAIAGLVVAAPLAARAYGLSLGRLADAVAPTVGVGIALARLGCFANGCCFGVPCSGPWCVAFARDSAAYAFHAASGAIAPEALASATVHPLQLYFAGAGLTGGLVALLAQRHRGYPGRAALLGLAVYLTLVAAIEPLRAAGPASRYLRGGPLQLQWVALALAGGAAVALGVAELWARRHAAASGESARACASEPAPEVAPGGATYGAPPGSSTALHMAGRGQPARRPRCD